MHILILKFLFYILIDIMKKKIVFILIALVLLIGCTKQKADTQTSSKLDSIITERSEKRKNRTIEILKDRGIPYSENIIPLPDENSVKTRTKEEVAYRAICLAVVAIKGDGQNTDKAEKINKIRIKYNIDKYLTPLEKTFLEDDNPTEEDSALFSWRYEAYYVLLWALKFIPELNFPDNICDVDEALNFLLEPAKGNFVKRAKLRSMTDIFNEADLIYRYHWAIVETGIDDPSSLSPGGLSYDVVFERHYTLNWLIRYRNAEWDDVTADA